MGATRRVLLASLAVLVGGLLLLALRGRSAQAQYAATVVDRGDILQVVGATGALQAVTTVQVGSQVSGNIASLGADFNSVVHKGQVIARLDPSLFQARVAQMKASLTTAVANVEKSKAAVDDARQKYDRARELAAQSLLPQSDLDAAQTTLEGARAQLKASQAAVEQAQANLNQAEVDLGHTVIAAPIDGVVIARNVDVGQTVAASFQAPVLFVIAEDLSRMQVNASVDEADIGQVHPGQQVTFRVDAYPDREFEGKVQQVRLEPIVNQNVVTYNTIISVANEDQRLMPGMTATVSIIVQKREGVLRLPASALRFRPEGFEERAPGGGARSRGAQAASARPAASAVPAAGRAWKPPSLVFVLDANGKPKPARVRLGLSDGRYSEVVSGLDEGESVITGYAEPARAGARPGESPSTNPFTPQRPQRRTR